MSRRRIRFIGLLLAASMAGIVVGVTPGQVAATSVDEAQQRLDDVIAQLDQLEEDVDLYTEKYVVAVDEKNQLDVEVAEAQARIAEKEAALAALESELSAMAVEAFVSGGTGGSITGLLTPGSGPTDAVKKQHLTELAMSAGGDDTDELDALIDDLAEEREALEEMLQSATERTAELEQHLAEAEASKAELTAARAEAQAEFGEALDREQERREQERLAAAQQILAQQAANAQSSSPPRAGGSSSASGDSDSGSSNDSSDSGGSSDDGGSSDSGGSSDDGGSSDSGGSVPQPSSRVGTVIQAAQNQLGVPYRYAAESPGVAFDCSGLTKYAWGRAGVYLPHQSRSQYASTAHVSQGAAQPGDLIFYYSPISHVGIYLGGGQLIHAPATGDVVKISSVSWGKVTGVGRPG
ncbi:MAG: C40 family peptidase [Ilumatobacteraceae bacterium]|nr:MAG: C40 family peptidase [Actinomycetota bacterium]